ncbi:MAG: CBM20 domain-containing protein, partial [Planctomycetota bacterium]
GGAPVARAEPRSPPLFTSPDLMSRLSLVVLVAVLAATAHAQPVTIALDLADRDLAGATVGVRGDTAPLSWEASLPLTDPDGDGVYTAEVAFPDGTGRVAYKGVLEPEAGEAEWEPGSNRLLLPGVMTEDRRAFGAAQTDLPVVTITAAQLAEDLAVLRDGMTTLHPGLQLHNTHADLAAAADRLAAAARDLVATYGDAIPVTAAYLPIAEAVAAIRDGHTQVSMYNQSSYTEAILYDRADRVLPAGTEILTLDGRPFTEVIDALMPYASADGGNDAKRIDLLQVGDLLAPAERFDVAYSQHFAPEGDLVLTVRTPDGTEQTLTTPRMNADARRDVLWDRDPDLPRSRDDLLRYDFLDVENEPMRR